MARTAPRPRSAYPREARLRENRRAERHRREQGRAERASALRHPEARRDAPALRSPARGRRRLQVVGRDARALARSRTTSASPSRSRIIRSTMATSKARSPKASTAAARSCSGIAASGRLRRDQSRAQSLRDGELKFVARRREAARAASCSCASKRAPRREARQLAADQASDEWATPGKDTMPEEGSLGRVGPHDDADRDRATARRDAVHDVGGKTVAPAAVWDTAGRRAITQARRSQRRQRSPDHRPPRPCRSSRIPSRVLWPGEPPVTKRDLADYLARRRALDDPHIDGRPCSFVRAPDGIDGEHFFQRHPMAGPAGEPQRGRRSTASTSPTCRSTTRRRSSPWRNSRRSSSIPGIRRRISRAFRAASSSISIPHRTSPSTWSSRPRGRCAHGSRSMGLVAFCKTTGGKGLHVVTPLVRRRRYLVGSGEAVRPNGRSTPRRRGTLALRDEDDEEEAHGTDLHRLPAQRRDSDGGRAALAARATWRNRRRCRSPGRR